MKAQGPNDVTQLLIALERGDGKAAEDLLPLLYDELRTLARERMAREPPGQTLQATALVHEAYLRLVTDKDARWNSRGHFFGAAAEAMRRILVERARRVAGPKRGGGRERIDLEGIELTFETDPDQMLALDEALTELDRDDPRAAEVVKLRFFSGLTVDETAAAMGISPRTARREWNCARAWLRQELAGDEPPPDPE